MKINSHNLLGFAPYSLVDIFRRGVIVDKCVPRKMASQRTNSDLQSPPRQMPHFPPLISRSSSTVTPHFTRTDCTRRDAFQRTAQLQRQPSVPTGETTSHQLPHHRYRYRYRYWYRYRYRLSGTDPSGIAKHSYTIPSEFPTKTVANRHHETGLVSDNRCLCHTANKV
jgi:hypothetical protein